MTQNRKYRYRKNLSRCLRADMDMAEANRVAKALTDAENKAEREAERQRLQEEIYGELEAHGLLSE